MDLRLSEEHAMMRKMVREFAEKEITPWIERMEEEEHFPREVLMKMAELGLMGIPIPEQWGGSGADYLSYILTLEELSRVSATVGVILAVHVSVGTVPILRFGSEEQKRKYIPKLAAGEYLGAFALTEPYAGSDASGIRTQAIKQGENYLLRGSKVFITNGGEADTYITFAVTDGSKAKEGISAFIVEKGTPGFRLGSKEKKMGLNGSNTAELVFDDVLISTSQLLGEEGDGLKIALANLNGGRIGIGAQALGLAQGAFEHAVSYARERIQFGKPIAQLQAIQFKLADMATSIEAARLLVYHAADLYQQGLPCAKEASMAKMFASNTAMRVTTEAVQVLGGYGYTRDYPVERMFRDAKVTQIYEGTNEIQHLVIANQLLK